MGLNTPRHLKTFPGSHFSLLLLAAVAIILMLMWPQAAAQKKSLGKCLTEKGAVMYGADSCENCSNQKKYFGDDFVNVNYVNCEFNHEQCQNKGITVYPVWAVDNKILVGTQALSVLSRFAGCDVPG